MEVLERLVAKLVSAMVAMVIAAIGLATAFGFLVAGAYMLLATDLPPWASALIVGGVLAVLAPLAALLVLRSGRTPASGAGGASGAGASTRRPASRRSDPPAGAEDLALSVAALDQAMRRSPWSILAAALAAGVMLGMSREARRSVADLLAALVRPPPR